MIGEGRVPRRALLQGALGGATLLVPLLLGGRAAAEQKLKKSEAKYQAFPKGQQRCEICLQYQPPGCKLVEGPVSPKGWCQYFAAKEGAH
jgi:hypothetical protein